MKKAPPTHQISRAAVSTFLVIALAAQSSASAQLLPREVRSAVSEATGQLAEPRVSSSRSNRAQQREQGQQINEVVDQIRDFRPEFSSFLMDRENALAVALEQVTEFRSQMEDTITPEFISMANDPNNRYAAQAAARADRWAQDMQRTMSALDLEEIKANTDQGQMLARYMTFVFQLEGLEQLRKVYPERPAIVAVGGFADDVLADFGSLAEIQALGEANYAAEIAQVRLYPARASNRALEADFSRAFLANPSVRSRFAGSEVLAVHLTNPGWTVTRHPVTGIVLKRDQQANLGIRMPDGKCYSYLVLFEQESVGGGRFGQTYMRSGRNQEMQCENMP